MNTEWKTENGQTYKKEIFINFNEKEYNKNPSEWTLMTTDGRKAEIYDIVDSASPLRRVIGVIKEYGKNANGKDIYCPCIWSADDGFAFNDEHSLISNDLYMKKYEILNYDNITSNDIPKDENELKDFQMKYDSYCQNSNKMNEVEYLRYLEMCKDHKNCHGYPTMIKTSFSPTGFGNLVTCTCENCKREIDITDNSGW